MIFGPVVNGEAMQPIDAEAENADDPKPVHIWREQTKMHEEEWEHEGKQGSPVPQVP